MEAVTEPVTQGGFSLELNQDQLDVRDWVRGFAQNVVRPAAHEWDEREETPWPVIQEAAKIGLYGFESLAQFWADPTGIQLPIVNEELFWGDAGIGMAIMARMPTCTATVITAFKKLVGRRVAASMTGYVRERAEWMAGLVEQAQLRGELDPSVSARAVAHLATALAIGSTLLTPDLHDVGDEEWTALLTRVVTSIARTEAQIGNRT